MRFAAKDLHNPDNGNYGEHAEYDPSDESLVVTSPNGSQEIYHKNKKTGQFEDSSGNQLNTDDIDRAHKEQEEAKEWSRKEQKRQLEKEKKEREEKENSDE